MTRRFREPTSTILAIKHAALTTHFAQERARIALETTTDTEPTAGHVYSFLGDEQKLRGIPAIGRGVQGAIAGTRP
jgi:hypothetical protein